VRVFISFSSRDREAAGGLADALRQRRPDFSFFLDERGLTGGVYWIQALGETGAVLLLLGATVGPWQELECYEALRLSRVANWGGRPRIVLVAIGDRPFPGLAFLSTLQQIVAPDLGGERALAEIATALSAAPAAAPW
jgi:TIR domain